MIGVGASQIRLAAWLQIANINFVEMNDWQLLNIGLLNPAFDLTPNLPKNRDWPSPKERGA